MSQKNQEEAEKKTMEELALLLREAEDKIVRGGEYAHYKHPEEPYRVLGLVIFEASQSVGVVYQPKDEKVVSFVRPLSEFLEDVVLPSGETVKRFARIG